MLALIGAAVWLANPNIDVPMVSSQDPGGKPWLLSLQDTPLLVLLALAAVGLLPFLRPDRFLASGSHRQSTRLERMVFGVLSTALLVGIPFFLIYVMARHDIDAHARRLVHWYSRDAETDRLDSTWRWQLDESDIQFTRWVAFWEHLEKAENDTVGAYIWRKLHKDGQEAVHQTTHGPLREAIEAAPIPITGDARATKKAVLNLFNESVLRKPSFADTILSDRSDNSAAILAYIEKRAGTMVEGHRLLSLMERHRLGRLLQEEYPELNRLLLEAYYGWSIWERAVVRGSVVVERDQELRWWVMLSAAGLALASSLIVGLNATSLHGIYRQQLRASTWSPWARMHPTCPCRTSIPPSRVRRITCSPVRSTRDPPRVRTPDRPATSCSRIVTAARCLPAL